MKDFVPILAIAAAVCALRSEGAAGFWEQRGSSPASAPGGSAVWTGKEVVYWGSKDVFGFANEGWRFDPQTSKWRPITTIGAPSPRIWQAALWTGSEVLIWGGFTYGQDEALNDGARFNPVTGVWAPLPTAGAPTGRQKPNVIWTGSEMIVWGGHRGGWTGPANGGGRFNPQTGEWKSISMAGAPTNRTDESAVWTGSEMIVWGGIESPNYISRNTGARYDPITDSWRPISATGAPSGRYRHSAIWTGTEMIVWGGLMPDPERNDGGRYDPVSDTWTLITTNAAPEARHGHTALWTGREMIVWGGSTLQEISGNYYAERGGRFDPEMGTWSPINAIDAPTLRISHLAVWTGVEMIICGGLPDSRPGFTQFRWIENSYEWGGRYHAANDSWGGDGIAPTTREGHGAVWTGEKMIVWGGINSEFRGDGGEYDVISNRWRRLPGAGAPSARTHHSTLWTGTEVLVWGGYGAAGYLKDGARYDAGARTWKAISTTNAPSERESVNAVWTGSTMIIWGGRASDEYRYDGGLYDVLKDEWTAMNTNGAPRGRRGNSAVWTGKELVVWGGFGWKVPPRSEDGYLGDGGRYNLQTGEWSPVSTNDAPRARSGHVTVWTGTEMIVWGGSSEAGHTNDGAVYDPEANSWSVMATEEAPTARADAVAVWTGREMIVWGGRATGLQGQSVALNDGARYDPSANKWTAMEDEVLAYARFGHTAIWTGTDMIIWGGHFEQNPWDEMYLNDTWSYSPRPPGLDIDFQGTNRRVSWHYPSSGFVVERSFGLDGLGWSQDLARPVRDDDFWRLNDTAAGERLFYRLRKAD